VLYLFVLAVYVLVLFVGPGLGTPAGLRSQVAAQKIVVYASVANLGTQAAGVRREARSPGLVAQPAGGQRSAR